MKVLEAIRGVMHDISQHGISKGQKNKEQGYAYRGIDDVLNALSPLYVKHGLVIIPVVIERNVTQSQTKSGSALWKVTVKVEYTLWGSDGSTITSSTYGEAMDSADKATNKALSAAYKYLAIQLFAIPVVGTPDADESTPEEQVPVITEVQVAQLKRLLAASGADESQFLEWLSNKAGYPINIIEEIPAAGFNAAVAALTKKVQAEA